MIFYLKGDKQYNAYPGVCVNVTCYMLYCLLCLLTKNIVNKNANWKMLVVLDGILNTVLNL